MSTRLRYVSQSSTPETALASANLNLALSNRFWMRLHGYLEGRGRERLTRCLKIVNMITVCGVYEIVIIDKGECLKQ